MQLPSLLLMLGTIHISLSEAWLFKKSRCFNEMEERWRCYDLSYPFTNSLFHYPHSPSKQNVHFKLYTPANPDTPDLLDARDATTAIYSHLNPYGTMAVIIHGFTDSSIKAWVLDMTRELLTVVDNVVTVDWGRGARAPNYFQAVANTRVVGAQLATLIHTLGRLGVDNRRLHLIGHSLGAHVAGYVGASFGPSVTYGDRRYPGSLQIGRITGLDPASLAFEELHEDVKLDVTDAAFVDVIHTDAPVTGKGAGVEERTGSVDFYPNGGNQMPGCKHKLIAFLSFTETMSCSHRRAVDFFTASVADSSRFIAFPCGSRLLWRSCLESCSSGCNWMGYHATSQPSGLFVLETQDEYPYSD